MSSLAILLALAVGTMKADLTDSGCILVEIRETFPAPPCDCDPATLPEHYICTCPDAPDPKHLHWLSICDPGKAQWGSIYPGRKP